MDLTTLGSAQTFGIWQPLGNGSRGCRLHPGALADCSFFLDGELVAGVDLLMLNRFGRGESEGRGFCDLISTAMALGIPVLTAARPTYETGGAAFGDGLTCGLPMVQAAVLAWMADLREVAKLRNAIPYLRLPVIWRATMSWLA